MRKIFLLSLCFFIKAHCFSQQGNNWYFGYNAGISFNTNPPTTLMDGALKTMEGCATMSDTLGRILFYTDGTKVYNSQHQVMSNGSDLLGHPSSANSAIIIPQPGSDHIYYIFTADASENDVQNGYRYSIVDMSLDNGLGDITTKNVLLYARNTEKLTAVTHANGVDIWIVTIEFGSNVFKVYKVDCNGINTIPVVSKAGLLYKQDFPPLPYTEAVGCLKASPDNKKIATTRIRKDGWEIFDFNNATGTVSNPLFIPIKISSVYGLEFSPNSQLAYVSAECCSGSIFQFKVDVHDSATIKNSMYVVYKSAFMNGASQRGPDGKIYVANWDDTTLNVINFPDRYGAACDFVPRVIKTNGRLVKRGLPVFYNAVIKSNSDFSYSVSNDCRTVTFSATSQLPPPLNWSWNFGDGTSATGQTINHTFPASGNDFLVTLNVANTNICGGLGKKVKPINFHKATLLGKFGSTAICGNKTVSFIDSSTVDSGAIVNWFWDFGDGQSSTDRQPVHTYASFGEYKVKLIITSSDFCQTKDTVSQQVSVNEKPVARFSFDKTCLNEPTTFKDLSTTATHAISKWYWKFGNGETSIEQNPEYIYTKGGSYNVSLITQSSNTCTDTVQRTLKATVKPIADFDIPAACAGNRIAFTDNSNLSTSAPTAWYWDLAGIINSSNKDTAFVFATPGSYTIKHTVVSEGSCSSDTAIKVILVEAQPNVNFGVITECGNKIVSFKDSSSTAVGSIVFWNWDFGSGQTSNLQNPVHKFSNFGSHPVKLVATTQNGCHTDTLTKMVTLAAKPSVQFDLPKVCLLDAYAQFVNTTTIEDNSFLSYEWKFGDFNAIPTSSDISSQNSPQYRYSAAANYLVKLIAKSQLGCKDSLTKSFTVNGAVPKARFSLENENKLCSNTDVLLKDLSTVDFGNITRIKIFWGDGDSTIDQSPSQAPDGKTYLHRYAYFGAPHAKAFTITMYAYSGQVCGDVTIKTIQINAAPQVKFPPLNEVCNEAPSFLVTGVSELWGLPGTGLFIGKGITDPETGRFDPQIAGTGVHALTYVFTTPDGCTADSTQEIVVNSTPKALFKINPACLPDAAIQFSSHSTVEGFNTSKLQHLWNFGDSRAGVGNPNTSDEVSPIHHYSKLDTFDVSLQIISSKGCSKDTIISILPYLSIYPQPTASFIRDNTTRFCQGVSTSFILSVDSMGKSLSKWWWNFGDGQLDSLHRKPEHAYRDAGGYTVSLKVENANGCQSEPFSQQVLIESIPQADFNFDTTCLGNPIQFKDLSTCKVGGIVNWKWDFNDGVATQNQHPTHVYNNYRDYKVGLIVSTVNGCSSPAVFKTISIKHVTVFAGKDTVASIGQPLQLQASGARTYLWSPSFDLNNATISDPIAILNRDQQFIVKGFTEEGCIGYDSIFIKVYNQAEIYVPNAFTPNGDGKNDYLHPVYVGMKDISYFAIYNRWGEVVYTTKDMNGRWDGRVKTSLQATASFVWIAKGTAYDGRVIERKGTVTIIR